MMQAIFLFGKHTKHCSYTAKEEKRRQRIGKTKYVRKHFLLHACSNAFLSTDWLGLLIGLYDELYIK